jgi:hypothetical protein
MRRIATTVSLSLGLLLVLASAALAHDGGQGTYGEASDKVITNFGFVVIALFPLVALFGSLLQGRLEKRKQARKAAAKARSSAPEWRGGW